jgi:hypothetical protein
MFLFLLKKSMSFPTILVFSGISQNYFCIGKIMNRVYGSRDDGCFSVRGGLTTMGQRGHSRAREVIVIAQRERERERERGDCRGSHQWRHLEALLQRWPHDNVQQR